MREMIDTPPDGGEAPVLEQQDREAFAEAGVLEKSRSLQPGDRLPPQPLVKTLEEVAEKLGERPLRLTPSQITLTSPCKAGAAAHHDVRTVIDMSLGVLGILDEPVCCALLLLDSLCSPSAW